MHQKVLCCCLTVVIFHLLITDSAKPKLGTECRVREYNFTAIKKDSAGKRCRDKIQSSGCFGACETLEVRNV